MALRPGSGRLGWAGLGWAASSTWARQVFQGPEPVAPKTFGSLASGHPRRARAFYGVGTMEESFSVFSCRETSNSGGRLAILKIKRPS